MGASGARVGRVVAAVTVATVVVEYALARLGGRGWPVGHPFSAISLVGLAFALALLPPSAPRASRWAVSALAMVSLACWVFANLVR
jgi:hypothetical protein